MAKKTYEQQEEHRFSYPNGTLAHVSIWPDPHSSTVVHWMLSIHRPRHEPEGLVGSERSFSQARATALRLLMRAINRR